MPRPPKSIPAAILSALVLAFPLAGCGEKDEPETTGPVVPAATESTSSIDDDLTGLNGDPAADLRQIRAAISGFLTSGDPVVCEQFLTSALIKKAYGDLKGCEAAQRPASAAESVEIDVRQTQETTATATAVPQGGASDGEKLEVGLVGEGSSWLIDSLDSNVPVGP